MVSSRVQRSAQAVPARQVEILLHLRVTISAQKIAFGGFSSQTFGRVSPAGADIQGKEFARRIVVVESEAAQTTCIAAAAALPPFGQEKLLFSANTLPLLPKVMHLDVPLAPATKRTEAPLPSLQWQTTECALQAGDRGPRRRIYGSRVLCREGLAGQGALRHCRPAQHFFDLCMAIGAQEVAFGDLGGKHLGRSVRAIPGIEGKGFTGWIAVME